MGARRDRRERDRHPRSWRGCGCEWSAVGSPLRRCCGGWCRHCVCGVGLRHRLLHLQWQLDVRSAVVKPAMAVSLAAWARGNNGNAHGSLAIASVRTDPRESLQTAGFSRPARSDANARSLIATRRSPVRVRLAPFVVRSPLRLGGGMTSSNDSSSELQTPLSRGPRVSAAAASRTALP
jgi:hypothetical protein